MSELNPVIFSFDGSGLGPSVTLGRRALKAGGVGGLDSRDFWDSSALWDADSCMGMARA
jgi:hypothetical protein